MKIIVCGAGQVGWQIARHLARESNDITIVDTDPALVRRATDSLDVQGVTGFASHPDVLKAAGAADADMLIAATHSDEVNMVTCQVAHSVFDVTRTIARLREESYQLAEFSGLFRRAHLPIDVIISPEREVSRAALQRLDHPAAFDIAEFMEGRALLAGVVLDDDCPVLNTPLRQLTELFSTLRAVVVGVRRGKRLFAPEPEDQLFSGDAVHVFAAREDVARMLEIFGKREARIRRVVVIGAGNVGLSVARSLERRPGRPRIRAIERDLARAEIAADALERTIVLNGDGMDPALLDEAGIADADAVLSLTDDDRTNMLASVRARMAGCPLSIALVNDAALVELAAPLGIDAIINPRATTVSSILRHIRHGRVRSVHVIGENEAEVIEAQVLSTSPLAGAKVREIDFPEGALLGGILRKGAYVRPHGDTRLEVGDIVAIFTLSGDIPEVEQLLQVAVEYF